MARYQQVMRRQRLGAFVGIAGLVAYCAFPLEWLVGSGLSPAHSYISELAVAGQPASWVFRVADLIACAGLMVLAWTLGRSLNNRLAWSASAALAVAAASSAVDAIWPMTCAVSIDWHCATQPLMVQALQPHVLSGVAGFTALVLAIALYSWLFLRHPGCRGLGQTGVAASTMVGGLGLLQIWMELEDADWIGVVERLQVSIVGVWFGAVALWLLRGFQDRSD